MSWTSKASPVYLNCSGTCSHWVRHATNSRAMSLSEPLRVGYVVRRYPRYSETFIVREILAHEQAGLDIEIFALRPPNDTHFQDVISRVRAPVNYVYLPAEGLIAEDLASSTLTVSYFWRALSEAGEVL